MRKLFYSFFIAVILISGCIGQEAELGGKVSEQVEQAPEGLNTKCSWAALNTGHETLEDGTLTFNLENIGTSDIEIKGINVLYNDGTQEDAEFTPVVLESNEIIRTSLPNIKSDIKTVKIMTGCQGLWVEISGSEINRV